MRRRSAILASAVTLLLLLPLGSEAQRVRSDKLKAEFLVRFAAYVTWPDDNRPQGTVQVCVIGERHEAVAGLDGRQVGDLAVSVSHHAEPAGAEGCHIAFINAAGNRAARLAAAFDDRPVLTVSDAEAFTANGGMIGFFQDEGRLRFEVHHPLVEEAGLALSSRLLALARVRR